MEHKHPISGIKDNLDVDFRTAPPTVGPAAPEVPTAFQSEFAAQAKAAREAEQGAAEVVAATVPAKTGFEAEMQRQSTGGRTPLDVPESAELSPDGTTEPTDPLEVVAQMKNEPLQTEPIPSSPAPTVSETPASAEKVTPPAPPRLPESEE
ncbi:hypothetical protein SEA_TEATEALATTE_41 [Gordonia phage Teatealatte]|uniref:Uncharacterized protein n=2 Tax=Demosthenesvirus katyusha TaxID=1982108 RepID=A0A345MCH2_9CAUD|nr:hypothetical protein SEA_TEATEALATTE_41 [Gordonia phage Teatealatte]QBP29599.1 hypothetical protein SEA_TREDGE_41 [Gordonia phage Tredge]